MTTSYQRENQGSYSYSLPEALTINFKDSPSLSIATLGLPPQPSSSPPDQPLPPLPKTTSQSRPASNNNGNGPYPTLKPALVNRPKSNPTSTTSTNTTNLKRTTTSKGPRPPPKKEVRMAPTAAKPTKAQTQCLEICRKTTHSIDLVAVHILESLTTTQHPLASFTQLSHDFLSTCEILYTLESGLASHNPAMQQLPSELLSELETKFRVTQTDFNSLNSMLQKMNAPKKGLAKSWGKMFGDSEGEIRKISAALKRTRESLKMSSLVFSWSLKNGSGKKVERGFGYTGLAAALDRLEPDETEVVKEKEVPQSQASPPPPLLAKVEPDVPPFPAPPAAQSYTQPPPSFPFGEINTQQGSPQPQQSQPHVQSQLYATPQPAATWSNRSSSVAALDGSTGRGHEFPHHARAPLPAHFPSNPDFQHNNQNPHLTNSTMSSMDPFLHSLQHDRHSAMDDARSMTSVSHHSRTDYDTSIFHEDLASLELDPSKVVRHSIDPSSMPRLYPPLSSEGETLNMKGALISAIRGKNHRLVETLLQRGVSTAAAPNIHPLKEAIFSHDEESIRLLLMLGADANEAGRDGVTPLLACVEKSFITGATMLLKYGANPNMGAGHGEEFESPLAVAVMANMVGMSQLLLQYNGDVNHQTSEGNPLLTAAIKKRTPKNLIDLLLAYGAKPNAKSREGKVALFEAISVGRADLTTALIEAGANVNLPGPKHMLWPSIHHPACLAVLLSHGADHKRAPGIMELAVGVNSIEVVRVLLKAGVNPDTKKDGTYTPLCSAIRDDQAALVKLLLSNGADPNVPAAEYPAFKCVTHDRVHFLPLLLESGVNLNKPKGIIEMAVSCNNLEALNWLLDQGVSPNDRNPKGMSPLTTAIRENRIDLVDLLLSKGADPHVRGEDWPIFMAVTNPPILERLLTVITSPQAFKGIVERAVHANQLESIRILLAAGSSVEDKTGGVFSPLTTAIREDHREIVKYLIDTAGADVNAPGEHLPVVKALRTFRGDETEILEWLLEKGADPNKMYRGWNGIMQAVENGNEGVLKLLARRSGVDLEVRDDMGHTVVEMASSRGFEEAVQILIEGDLGVTLRN